MDRPALEATVKAHAEATGIKLGKFAQPLRAALTGTSTSPGISMFWKCWDVTKPWGGLRIK